MRVNCCTCLELLTSSDELSSTPCGHVLHTQCILQWLETGKNNCPQCRTKCRENLLRRIYFTEGMDTSVSETDSSALQNKLDSLTFQLRCSDTEKKAYKEKVDQLTAHNIALKDEIRTLDKKYKGAKDDVAAAKHQARLLQGEKERGKLARKQVNELTEELEGYTTIKIALQGTQAAMMERLHSMRDYSENSKQLCQLAETLKKELTEKGCENHKLLKSIQRKSNECGELKTKLDDHMVKVNELTAANKRLRTDMELAEEEKEVLKSKITSLQDAITSPSGDPRSSAIARLIYENPAPLNMTLFQNEPARKKSMSPPPPRSSTKTCSIVGLKRSPCKNVSNLKRAVSSQESSAVYNSLFKRSKFQEPQSLSQPIAAKKPEHFFDGMGGHSRADYFPTSSASSRGSFSVSKKSKPSSQNKTSSATDQKKLQTINKYFTFDTP